MFGPVAKIMEGLITELDGTGCSRLAWLYLYLGD